MNRQLLLPTLLALFALAGAGMAIAGAVDFSKGGFGQAAEARVEYCSAGRCTGYWYIGRRRITGLVDGATVSDIDRALSVRVRGTRAYTPAGRHVAVMLALGLLIAVLGAAAVFGTLQALVRPAGASRLRVPERAGRGA